MPDSYVSPLIFIDAFFAGWCHAITIAFDITLAFAFISSYWYNATQYYFTPSLIHIAAITPCRYFFDTSPFRHYVIAAAVLRWLPLPPLPPPLIISSAISVITARPGRPSVAVRSRCQLAAAAIAAAAADCRLAFPHAMPATPATAATLATAGQRLGYASCNIDWLFAALLPPADSWCYCLPDTCFRQIDCRWLIALLPAWFRWCWCHFHYSFHVIAGWCCWCCWLIFASHCHFRQLSLMLMPAYSASWLLAFYYKPCRQSLRRQHAGTAWLLCWYCHCWPDAVSRHLRYYATQLPLFALRLLPLMPLRHYHIVLAAIGSFFIALAIDAIDTWSFRRPLFRQLPVATPLPHCLDTLIIDIAIISPCPLLHTLDITLLRYYFLSSHCHYWPLPFIDSAVIIIVSYYAIIIGILFFLFRAPCHWCAIILIVAVV